MVEHAAPDRLASGRLTELVVYGGLLYAGSRTLQARLPDPLGSAGSVVVLRLRGRTNLGATFVAVLGDYARRLEDAGGRLSLSGVDPEIMAMLERTGQVNGEAPVRAYAATEQVGEATAQAVEDGTTWIVRHQDG